MKTTVVNLYKEPYDIYIGREGQGKSGYFGNPFKDGTRDTKIQQFKKYFYDRVKSDPEFRNNVLQLRGKALGCFCKPQTCHGDIIAEYVNSYKENHMKFAVIGVRYWPDTKREFDDYEFVQKILKWHDISKIISGGALGADSLAAKYANENEIPLQEFIPNWDKHGRTAALIRNKDIIDAADEVIAFWDQKSRGTGHAVTYAYEKGKNVHIFWPEEIPTSRELTEDEIIKLG